jgi:hypothetical protein
MRRIYYFRCGANRRRNNTCIKCATVVSILILAAIIIPTTIILQKKVKKVTTTAPTTSTTAITRGPVKTTTKSKVLEENKTKKDPKFCVIDIIVSVEYLNRQN